VKETGEHADFPGVADRAAPAEDERSRAGCPGTCRGVKRRRVCVHGSAFRDKREGTPGDDDFSRAIARRREHPLSVLRTWVSPPGVVMSTAMTSMPQKSRRADEKREAGHVPVNNELASEGATD